LIMVGVKHLRPFDDKVFDAGFVYISAYDIWVDPNHAAALAARVPTNVRSKLDDEQRRSLILGRTGRDWPLHETVSAIDRRDECTPDRWIPRHPHLIRLSGRHPFNCETPLQDLVQKGFITPTSLRMTRCCLRAFRVRATVQCQLQLVTSDFEWSLCRLCQKPWCCAQFKLGHTHALCYWPCGQANQIHHG